MRWDSVHNPTGLVDMVHAGWVQRLLRAADWRGFPGPGDDEAGGQTRIGPKAKMIFEKLSDLGISYVHEPPNSVPGTQDVRPVDEVLSLGLATCLDMCVTYCCAALDAGVYPLILTLTARNGKLRHAIVLVPLERSWSTGCDAVIESDFSREPLMVDEDDFKDVVIDSPDDPSGTWLAIDVQQASAPPGGATGKWDTALSKGADYVRNWEWDLCVDIGGLRSRRADNVDLPTVMGAEGVLVPAYIPSPKNPTPLQLIQTRYGVVSFCPRRELRTLRRWVMAPGKVVKEEEFAKLKNKLVEDVAETEGIAFEDDHPKNDRDPDLAVAVVTGAGGSGKTRLAAQLCHDLSSIGWCTGFLPTTTDITVEELSTLAELTTELLVVVDYAEETRRGQLATLFRALRDRRSPTRIVLTARGTDVWWDEFREELEQDGIDLSKTLIISHLGRNQLQKNPLLFDGIFRRAVQGFAEQVSQPPLRQDIVVPENLGATALDVVLMAWLVVCDESAGAAKKLPTRNGLYDRVLTTEFAQWRKAPALAEISGTHMRQAAATLSLLAPSQDEDEVDEVLSRLPEWASEHLRRSRFAELLVHTLLRVDGEGAVNLRPDPVAEHLILEVFSKRPDLLAWVLPTDPLEVPGLEDPDADEMVVQRALALGQQAQNACTVITRADSLDSKKAHRLAGRVLRARPHLWSSALDVTINQGGPFAPALEELIASGADLPLAEIEDAIPLGHGVLRGAALAATRRLAASAERSPEQQARWANTLAIRLSEAGERGEALEAAREAADLYKALAEESPAAYTSDLAASLNNLAIRLSEAGERGEALEAAREAADLYKALAGASPAAYTPDLASSLNNLANHLSEAGERGEALEAAREAVRLRRVLAGASPAAYTPDLASSLNNLANRLSEAGERGEALHIFIEDFDRFSPATRARLLLARASWRHDNQEEDLVAAAHEADGKDVPALLGPARREVACAVANSKQSLEGLPSWAVATIDAETRNRIESWLNCADLAERANLLEKMWKSPSESDCATLCAAAELYVDVPPIRDLAVLVDRVAKKGIQNVTFCLRWQYRAQMLATSWYSAHKGGRGAHYLRKQMVNGGDTAGESHSEREKNMADPDMRSEVFRLLEVSLPEEEANKLKSIFCLADLSSPETAYEVYGRAEDAEDALEELLGNGNWRAMIAALEVRPSLKDSGYGAVAAAFAASMNNDADRALEFMKCACRTIDSIDRQRIEGILEHILHEDDHPRGFADLYEWIRQPGKKNE